jgi:hypothetical protein
VPSASSTKECNGKRALPRLCVKPEEAAEMLGVSRDYLDEHIKPELQIIRRGSRTIPSRSRNSSAGSSRAPRAAAEGRDPLVEGYARLRLAPRS